MKKVTVEYEVYNFSELSDDAKEVVKDWYLEGQSELSFIFTEDCVNQFNQLSVRISKNRLRLTLSYTCSYKHRSLLTLQRLYANI